MTIQDILREISDRNYKLYTGVYQLNIIGIRNSTSQPSKFDDEIHVIFQDEKNTWQHFQAAATTVPGLYWLQNPIMTTGTAILCPGQYVDSYQIGLHQGKYKALVQARPGQ